MNKQNRLAAIVVGIMCLFVVFLVVVDPMGVKNAANAEEEDVTYDLYRSNGDTYCHLGDTVTFTADVIDYYNADMIGDEATTEDSSEATTEDSSEATTEDSSEIDYSQFQFQWYYCQHIADTSEIVYVPIEGANDLSYTVDHVTEADLYDNDELEYVLAMFPADATDLSYGNRINISSIWFCLSEVPDFVDANETNACTLDSEGSSSKNDCVAFSTFEAGDFQISVDNVSDANATVSAYVATLDHDVVVAENELEFGDGDKATMEMDPAYTYIISWSTDSEKTISFDYTISGESGEPYKFSASDLEPSDASLNAYVDEISIRSDGEYQITVENPWVDADYVSSDEDVATVSDDGKIWAVAPGEATITVTQDSKSQDILVTVV